MVSIFYNKIYCKSFSLSNYCIQCACERYKNHMEILIKYCINYIWCPAENILHKSLFKLYDI